ncbi:TPA: PTS system mannose/fructose/sorbose family transporter subunit IID [Escherichia coli]
MASNQTTLPNVSENEETLLTGVNENVYEDQSIGAELTKKDINRVAWRSMLLQASFNYERMQASGWLYGLLPALKKIHTNKRDLARAMKGHMGFFNTHPFLVTFVIGIILAMERSKQDVNSIQSTKIAVGALVATYVRLSTTLEITAGDAVVKLQADVIDKLMPAFLPLVYTLTMFWLVRRGWSPLRLIAVTVVLGIVGKFCHFL